MMKSQPVASEPDTFDEFVDDFFVVNVAKRLQMHVLLPLGVRNRSPHPMIQNIFKLSVWICLFLSYRQQLRNSFECLDEIIFGNFDYLVHDLLVNVPIGKPKMIQNDSCDFNQLRIFIHFRVEALEKELFDVLILKISIVLNIYQQGLIGTHQLITLVEYLQLFIQL